MDGFSFRCGCILYSSQWEYSLFRSHRLYPDVQTCLVSSLSQSFFRSIIDSRFIAQWESVSITFRIMRNNKNGTSNLLFACALSYNSSVVKMSIPHPSLSFPFPPFALPNQRDRCAESMESQLSVSSSEFSFFSIRWLQMRLRNYSSPLLCAFLFICFLFLLSRRFSNSIIKDISEISKVIRMHYNEEENPISVGHYSLQSMLRIHSFSAASSSHFEWTVYRHLSYRCHSDRRTENKLQVCDSLSWLSIYSRKDL